MYLLFQWLDAREKFEKAGDLVGLDGKGKKTMWGQFWSAHQVSKTFFTNFVLRIS